MDGLDTPLDVDTKIVNALLGLAKAFVAAQLASRDTGISALQASKADTADINYYGRTVAVHDLLKGREYNRDKAMEGFDEVDDPRIARAVLRGRAAAPHHGGHPALREDAAAAAEPGDRNRVCGRHDCAVVRERRGAPGGGHAEHRL